jgi:glycosyltransferase involved in cell wall biosynthesis
MPAFNAAQHIRQSIQSVLEQTFDNWDLIIVDDGSTDGTAAVAGSFSDSRIRCISQENGGQAAARNTGITSTQGEFIAFLDADDLWLPEKLDRQIAVARRTSADVVYCDGYVFFDAGNDERSDFFAVVPGLKDGATMVSLLYQHNRIATLSAMVKRNVIESVGRFDESRLFQNCEDYELWLRLARAGSSFYGMPDKLMRYRRHESSTTHRDSRMLRPMIEVVKKHGDAVDEKTSRTRIRGLYRDLITALIAEDDVAGARQAMGEFAAWDPAGMITQCQRILLRLFPKWFARISRRCLYPIEWRLSRLL